jgi:hypothetical protein
VEDQTIDENPPGKAPEAKAPAATRAADAKDLSAEIARTVERQPLDQVRCVRVFGDYYRCNWWSPTNKAKTTTDFAWASATTDHVRKSSFLSASMKTGRLVIEEVKQAVVED